MDEKDFVPDMTIEYPSGRYIFGRQEVRRYLARDMKQQLERTTYCLGEAPTLLGEIGIPFDMQDKRAYQTGDFSVQVKAMDASLAALEANLLGATIWTYSAANDNQWGDQWNGEDFSIFSRDQQTDPEDINSGGRALDAVLRPYARKIAGEPTQMQFDLEQRYFDFEFKHDPDVEAPTEIFVPNFQYPNGYEVQVSDGSYEIDTHNQVLIYSHSQEKPEHRVSLRPKGDS
jgi:hypothetical protein